MVERRDIERAREIVADFADQNFSFMVAANFAVKERLGIKKAFSFDRHFRIYRFGRDKGEKFEAIP